MNFHGPRALSRSVEVRTLRYKPNHWEVDNALVSTAISQNANGRAA